jgi:hypothetical protein
VSTRVNLILMQLEMAAAGEGDATAQTPAAAPQAEPAITPTAAPQDQR